MKPINKYLVNRHVSKTDVIKELTEEEVRSYIYKGYDDECEEVTIRYEHGDPIVDIEGDFIIREDINKIPFQFGTVTGTFDCSGCKNLTSLKGCPMKVGAFTCADCKNLTSLEGCPKIIQDSFGCHSCTNLASLEGCPNEVEGNFVCYKCTNLTSLEGCPKKVGGVFSCFECGKQFTKDEVIQLCNVKGNIIV